MKRFENKVALVTGGRTGIGRAIAQRLQTEGARVFTAQRQPDSDFESIEVDFSDIASGQRVIDEVIDRAESLHILINNAGVMTEGTVEECQICLLYTSPSPRDATLSRMPSSA